jgi:hypothetical protein
MAALAIGIETLVDAHGQSLRYARHTAQQRATWTAVAFFCGISMM